MKTIVAIFTVVLLSSFTMTSKNNKTESNKDEVTLTLASFKLVNDTKSKVSIHTGSGFVSLNKGGSTSISCNTGKEVRWADSGSKGDVIFKISNDHCGKTIKLSKFL